jgi:hypothetical protein
MQAEATKQRFVAQRQQLENYLHNTTRCRHAILCQHFGEESVPACVTAVRPRLERLYPLRVSHSKSLSCGAFTWARGRDHQSKTAVPGPCSATPA